MDILNKGSFNSIEYFSVICTKQLDDLVSYALKYLQALHSKKFDVTLEQLQHLLLINTWEHIAKVLFLMNINTNVSHKWLYTNYGK